MSLRGRRARRASIGKVVVLVPDLAEDCHHATKGAAVTHVAQLGDAVLQVSAESAASSADGAANEVDPDHAAVEAIDAVGDALQSMGELVQQCHGRGLVGAEAGDEAAEVDASCQAESSGDVLGQLLGGETAVLVEGKAGDFFTNLRHGDLLAQRGHVLAQHKVVHAALLERLEAGNLRDEVHDTVIATHQLA